MRLLNSNLVNFNFRSFKMVESRAKEAEDYKNSYEDAKKSKKKLNDEIAILKE